MIKKVIKHFAMRRNRSKNFNRIHGIYVPKDRRLWSDELERELTKAHSRWM